MRMATTSLCTQNHHHCCQLMLPMTMLGIHLTTAWHLTLQISNLQNSRHQNQGLIVPWISGWLPILRLVEMRGWSSAEEMYAMIDAIQAGNAPWKMITFWYNRPHPANPPKWMLETCELCTCNSCLVLCQQLATTDFMDKIGYVPYRQFKSNGDHIWSNLMSADWAWAQAVCCHAPHPEHDWSKLF